MQQRTGSIAGFYRAQFESAQDLTAASMEGFERIQQLALQALRQQIDDQFRLVNTMAARSAEAMVDPDLARPALDRMIDVQRQMAETFVRTNRRVLSAVGASAQRSVEQGAATASNGGQAGDEEDGYTAMVQAGLQQWQELTNRMLDVVHEQFSAATGEVQRQGQRAVEQTSQAVQTGVRGLQEGTRQTDQATAPAGRVRAPERKPEMA